MLLQTAFIALVVAFIELCDGHFHKLPNGGEIKAVLIAGSNGYDNYAQQAGVCHAYQILRENGIPEENIIVMMYDDIAYNPRNPHKGVIINRPGGPDVYKNVKKDYVGKDVNKKVFFDVLLGNKEGVKGIGTGRVLESGPNDHVFVNYVDHGSPGVLYLPGEGYITASEFLGVLEKMSNSSRFHKMFLYIEACYSGSMFEHLLPDDLNIFAMTAANPHETAWACFCHNELQTCIGDEFGVKWMRVSETVDLKRESVNRQFQKVRREVTRSHVQEYGDIAIGKTKLSEVMGYRQHLQPPYEIKCDVRDAIPAPHVPVAILEERIQSAKTPEEKERLQKKLHDLLEGRREVTKFFSKLIEEFIPAYQDSSFTKRPALTKSNIACYENALTHLNNKCFKISNDPFVASQLHNLISLCDVVPEAQIVEKIKSLCHGQPKRVGIV